MIIETDHCFGNIYVHDIQMTQFNKAGGLEGHYFIHVV